MLLTYVNCHVRLLRLDVKSNSVTGLVVAQRGGRGIALPFQDLGSRRG